MKKIIAAAFWVLLAGSIGVQSCKKPDTTPDPVVNPTVPPGGPTVPSDSTKTGGPTTPLTEEQIIQKAIANLPGNYLMWQGQRQINDVSIDSLVNGVRYKAKDTSGSHTDYSQFYQDSKKYPSDSIAYHPDLSNIPLRTPGLGIKHGANTFFNKILVNAEGDSFITAVCIPKGVANAYNHPCYSAFEHNIVNHAADYADLSTRKFRNLKALPNLSIDFGKYDDFLNNSWYEIQYFYNKDSLSLYGFNYRNHSNGQLEKNRFWSWWAVEYNYSYGTKIK